MNVKIIKDAIEIEELLIQFNPCFPHLSEKVLDIKNFAEKLSIYANVIAIQDNSKTIGMVAFYANDKVAKIGFITLIGVIPAYRSKGIGSKLYNLVLETMIAEGMQYIKLEVDEDNVTAIRFYERLGFIEDGKTNRDSLFMIKKI